MTETLRSFVHEVQTFLQDDPGDPQFSRRTIVSEVNNSIAWAISRGVIGTYVFSSAISLVTGDVLYELSAVEKDHSDGTWLNTAAADVMWVRRHADGVMLERITTERIESLLIPPTLPTGPPTHYALFVIGQDVEGYTAVDPAAGFVTIYPAPSTAENGTSLDVAVRLRHSVLLSEMRDSGTVIGFDDTVLRGMVMNVCGMLLARATAIQAATLKVNPAVASQWLAAAENLIAIEATRQYKMHLPGDIQLLER